MTSTEKEKKSETRLTANILKQDPNARTVKKKDNYTKRPKRRIIVING